TAAGEPDMPPLNITGGIADQMGAIMLAYGIMAAPPPPPKNGGGQGGGTPPPRKTTAPPGPHVSLLTHPCTQVHRQARVAAPSPLWNHYQCSDGKWICLAMAQQDRYWANFCKVLGVEQVLRDPRFETMAKRAENAKDLVPILDKAFATKPRDYWMKVFKESGGDIIHTPVNSIAD